MSSLKQQFNDPRNSAKIKQAVASVKASQARPYSEVHGQRLHGLKTRDSLLVEVQLEKERARTRL